MPWKDTKPMDERIKFISDRLSGAFTVTELAVIYGISRKTAYKWIARYDEHGIDGLKELSRIPKSCPHKTYEALVPKARRAGLLWKTLLSLEVAKSNFTTASIERIVDPLVKTKNQGVFSGSYNLPLF